MKTEGVSAAEIEQLDGGDKWKFLFNILQVFFSSSF
jgi:hypothetical protein